MYDKRHKRGSVIYNPKYRQYKQPRTICVAERSTLSCDMENIRVSTKSSRSSTMATYDSLDQDVLSSCHNF